MKDKIFNYIDLQILYSADQQNVNAMRGLWSCNNQKGNLKGLSHEMDFAFDDMHGQF